MIKQILTNAGFIENETFRETRFIKPPRTTYAIYLDSYTRRGADNSNLVRDHDYTIEVYSYFSDPEAEDRIEAVLDNLGIAFDKSESYWIQDEQLYQVVYTFNYIEK